MELLAPMDDELDKQKQMVRRIQADLWKEATRYRDTNNGLLASDYEGQAEGLNDVLASLQHFQNVRDAIRSLR